MGVGVQEAVKGVPIERCKILPIQVDFSIAKNIEACRSLLERILGEKPILFSILGNTIANFEHDNDLLILLSKLLRPQDRLLLEVAYTENLSEMTVQEATEEYSKSRAFREFVTSALLQNTDLRPNIEDVSFVGSIEEDKAIRIKAIYHNRTGTPLKIMLPDRTEVDFPIQDTIRLYLTRKYTSKGIDTFINECGFSALAKEYSHFSPNHNRFKFGTALMLLNASSDDASSSWQSAFISYGSPGQDFAEKLNKALKDKGVKTFFFDIDSDPGDKAHTIMRKGVNEFDRTLLICSKHSLERLPVLNEIDLALARESREGGSNRLLPITLDRYVFDAWLPKNNHVKTALLDRNICDFTNIHTEETAFVSSFGKLLNALKLAALKK